MKTSVTVVDSAEGFLQYRDLVCEYERSLPSDLRHPSLLDDLERLALDHGPPNALFVATVGDEAGGCVALTPLDATTGIIQRLYVQPSRRNLGLARALLSSLVGVARERGLTRVVLDTDREQLRAAYLLYVSLGFEECAPYGEVDYATPTFMELRL